MWEKEKSTCYKHFPLSQNVFKKPLLQGLQKLILCGKGLKIDWLYGI